MPARFFSASRPEPILPGISNDSPDCSAETAQEARSRYLLNPPPSRTLARTAHHLRDFSTWRTETLLLLLENVENKLADLAPQVESPSPWMTGATWEDARAKVEEWGAIMAAGRKVLAGRK